MNSDPLFSYSDFDSSTIINQLIAHLKLGDEAQRGIRDLMASNNISFLNAAVQLNFLTQSQADELVMKLNETRMESPGIIEAARRKMFSRPSVVVINEPIDKCKPSSKLTIAHDPYSDRSEKLRGLRTELTLRFNGNNKAAMLAIVSPEHGEGRSQLAGEMAIAFAQLDRKTLLVDADLRHPNIHNLFQCSNSSGLANALLENTEPHLFGVEGTPNLHVLPAGPAPSNPIELLSSKKFEQLINSWRQHYDFVLLDTPPITNYADALTVSTLVKSVLLVTRANQTRMDDAKKMLRRLSITHSEILGAVVNTF